MLWRVHLGLTRLSIVARHLKTIEEGEERDALVPQALAHAEKYTAHELPSILEGRPPKTKPHSILLRLNARQYKVFEAAVLGQGATAVGKRKVLVGKERALIRALGGRR